MSSVKHRLAKLERSLPPKPEPDPYRDALFEMIEIVYDTTLTEEKRRCLVEAFEWPEPTTQYARQMNASFLKFYGIGYNNQTQKQIVDANNLPRGQEG